MPTPDQLSFAFAEFGTTAPPRARVPPLRAHVRRWMRAVESTRVVHCDESTRLALIAAGDEVVPHVAAEIARTRPDEHADVETPDSGLCGCLGAIGLLLSIDTQAATHAAATALADAPRGSEYARIAGLEMECSESDWIVAALAQTYVDDERHSARANLAVALHRFEPQEPIAALLTAQLLQEPVFGADLLAAHGDPSALPALETELRRVACSDPEDDETRAIGRALDRAIHRLGGELTGSDIRRAHGATPWRGDGDTSPCICPRCIREALSPRVPFRAPPSVGANDPCLCGSGRKFKKCCR